MRWVVVGSLIGMRAFAVSMPLMWAAGAAAVPAMASVVSPSAGDTSDSTAAECGVHRRMLTALAMTRSDVSSAATLCTAMSILARADKGIVSVGLNAVELVTDTYR